MRLVKVKAPSGLGQDVMKTAFAVGIETVSFHAVTKHSADGTSNSMDVIDVETSTPKAHSFIDKLLAADYFDREQFSFNVREPRSVLSGEDVSELTKPLAVPPVDLFEELWQFSHITYSLIGRVFISACLLAYGLIQQQTLLIIAGLLFLPLLPMLTAIGFGGITRNWKLCMHGITAFAACVLTLFLGGVAVGAVSSPPMRYDEFTSLPISLLITAAVGIAAGLAAIDDVGRRELIGLAAAAQLGIIPVWLGVTLVFGTSPGTNESEIYTRILTFALNVLMLLLGSVAIYWLSGMATRGLQALEKRPEKSGRRQEAIL